MRASGNTPRGNRSSGQSREGVWENERSSHRQEEGRGNAQGEGWDEGESSAGREPGGSFRHRGGMIKESVRASAEANLGARNKAISKAVRTAREGGEVGVNGKTKDRAVNDSIGGKAGSGEHEDPSRSALPLPH